MDNKDYSNVRNYLLQIITGLPKLLVGEWTYCSDELPENEDTYLVMWRTTDTTYRFYELLEFCEGEWVINIPQAKGKEVKVLAWQELPDLPMED